MVGFAREGQQAHDLLLLLFLVEFINVVRDLARFEDTTQKTRTQKKRHLILMV